MHSAADRPPTAQIPGDPSPVKASSRTTPAWLVWPLLVMALTTGLGSVLLGASRSPLAAQAPYRCTITIEPASPLPGDRPVVTIVVSDGADIYEFRVDGVEGSRFPAYQGDNTYRYEESDFAPERTYRVEVGRELTLDSTAEFEGTLHQERAGTAVAPSRGSCEASFVRQIPATSLDRQDYPRRGTPLVTGTGFARNHPVSLLAPGQTDCDEGITGTTDEAGRFSLRLTLADDVGPGAHAIGVCQDNNSGYIWEFVESLPFTVVNTSPSLDLVAPTSYLRAVPLGFSATATDPDGDPLTIAWRLLDRAGTELGRGTGATFDGVVDDLGSYTVVVTARDPTGAVAEQRAEFQVVNRAPSITLDCPTVAEFEETVVFGAEVTDDVAGWQIAWSSSTGDRGRGPSFAANLLRSGHVEVVATVTDADAASDTATCVVDVAAPPPEPPSTSTSISTGGPDEPTPTTTAPRPTTDSSDPGDGIADEVGIGLGAVAIGAALVAGAAYRRRDPAPTTDPCAGRREVSSRAEREAVVARERADAAAEAVFDAEANVADLQGRLDRCQESGSGRSGLRALPLTERRPDTPVYADDYVLLSIPNVNGPTTSGGQGWFDHRPDRAVDAVVLHLLDPTTLPEGYRSAAGAAAHLTTIDVELSAHVAVDRRGPIDLLPSDSYQARHTPAHDERTAAVMITAPPGPADPALLTHLASKLAELCRLHRLPPELVTADDLDAGSRGLIPASELTVDPPADVDWSDVAERVERELARRPVPAAVVGSPGTDADDPCASLRAEVAAAEADLERARTEAADAEARADEAERQAAERGQETYDCDCRFDRDPPAPGPAPGPEAEEPGDDPGRFHLLANENPFAPLRSNGKRGWYRPYRTGTIRGLVIHTAEGPIDPALDPAGGIARYLAETERGASAHAVTDSLRRVDLLPDHYTAFHARGGNSNGLGLEIAYHADLWGTDPPLESALLAQAVLWAAEKCLLHGIPRVRLTADQWRSGSRGLVAHAQLDPRRRHDPGPAFPWDHFLELIDDQLGQWSLGRRG